jgi:hypothetical protein
MGVSVGGRMVGALVGLLLRVRLPVALQAVRRMRMRRVVRMIRFVNMDESTN